MHCEITLADLANPVHQAAILRLLDAYAADPMGDGKPLGEYSRQNLIAGLQSHPTTLVFLALREEEPLGIAVCFSGFSTFAARPLINIHDFFVIPGERGSGIGRKLLEAVEQKAQSTGCCKLTLEVQENNERARRIYQSFGFAQSTYTPEAGGALFLAKLLTLKKS